MKVDKYIKLIENAMLNHPGEYVYLDDLMIDTNAPKFSKAFDDGYKYLISIGRLDIIGNRVKINQ